MQLEVGAIVEGKVSGIAKFGAFVDLPEGKVGMIHISEVASVYVNEIGDFLKEGQTVNVKILSIGEDGKISLSIKKAMENGKSEKPVGKKFSRPAPNPPARPVSGPGNFEWSAKKTDNSSFEEMMNHYKQSSEERISDIKRGFESKRGGNSKRGSSK